jgi:NRPS condensation-like uncharacterized protein
VTASIAAAPKDYFYQRGRGTGGGSASDQQIRFVLRYGGLLDLPLLQRAVRAVVDGDPILRARLVEPRPFEGRWELRDDGGAVPACELAEVADAEPAIAAFLADLEVRDAGPYLRLRVVRAGGRDALCLRVDHRLCDGGGTRILAYRLAEAYRRLAAGEPPPPPRDEFHPRTVAGLTNLEPPPPPETPASTDKPLSWVLPRRGYTNERPAHAVRVIDAATVAAVRAAGKPLGATLTDAMVAALVQALHPHRTGPADASLTLMVSADYRSRLPPAAPEVLCNLFQGFFPELHDDPARSIRAAVTETARAMARCRATFTLDDALRTEVAVARSSRRFADMGPHPQAPAQRGATFVLLSNVGALDAARLELGAPPLLDAQLLGTVALGRELLLCTSSFRGALTLSIGYCASDVEPAVFEGILERMVRGMAELAAS